LLFYVTLSDVFRIVDAMKVKGVDVETKNPIRLARNIPKFGVPVFMSVLKRSNTMMSVLKMRGYSFSGDRELRTELKFDTGDTALLLGTAFVLLGTVAVRLGLLTVPYLPSGGAG
ncbi:MAG: hypothetical protein SV760_09510, partial [Halobacteria archaeon]|nr:hypothetical protein [Halobacteria archaeon]